jgi:predicted MFS family arabinose efflux permease
MSALVISRHFKAHSVMWGHMQARIWIGILIGSTIGGFIPDLWGAGLFSYSSVLLSGFGAVVGLLIGYKLA